MYSIFDLLFDSNWYRPVYVISDSEMKKLQRTQKQEEFEKIINKRKDLKNLINLKLNILKEDKKN